MGLSRLEAYTKWGLIREIEPLTAAAYEFFEWLEERKQNIGGAANYPWHVSFHGSQFPGDDPYACPRKAIYTMMDIPRSGIARKARVAGEVGKAIEDATVFKWYLAGYLLSAPPPPIGDKQTEFEDVEHRLTSTVDAIVIHPNENRGKVVEVKGRYAAEIDEMIKLCRGPHPEHVRQVKCQIGMAHEKGSWLVRRCYNSGRLAVWLGGNEKSVVCPEHGGTKCLYKEEIEPVDRGFLFYVSRDNPEETWEFMYEYDPEFMAMGRRQLSAWNQWWNEGYLPQANFSDKRFSHPLNWTWTRSKKHPESPCEWCDYGDACRGDHRLAVEQGSPIPLINSTAITMAKEFREDYELDLVKEAIEQRWAEPIVVHS